MLQIGTLPDLRFKPSPTVAAKCISRIQLALIVSVCFSWLTSPLSQSSNLCAVYAGTCCTWAPSALASSLRTPSSTPSCARWQPACPKAGRPATCAPCSTTWAAPTSSTRMRWPSPSTEQVHDCFLMPTSCFPCFCASRAECSNAAWGKVVPLAGQV
jgi:hypothetical protein